ncbi:hypothetical protein QLX08_009573 [Tetragonisca angustula]|uniref:RIIa domain-containing protein n=1 Tax=Tetragonisca angustula TaxID=166442 RepID=A0AAW0ZFQ7_9HYME
MSEMDYIIVPRIPRGLAPAVEGLAREILRQRPRNIYAFAAEHFAELVKLRDKERTGEVVSKILQHKLLNKRDSVVDWAKLDNGNKNDVDVAEICNDHFHNFHKYDNSMEEAMVTREAKKSTKAWRIATRNAAPAASKRKGERAGSGSKSGWSINRTVKALKQHHEYRAISSDIEQKYEEDCNKGLNGKETEKVVADYADYPDHLDCPHYPFVRSSSAGNIMYAKRVKKSREVGENLDKFCTTLATLDDKSYRNEKDLTRQKSADQIERTCVYFKDIRTNEDADTDVDIADRKRSGSLVNNGGRNEWNVMRQKTRRQQATVEGRVARNWKDEWKSVMEDQRKEQEKLREKFDDAREDDATLNLQLEKRNDKVSKEVNETGGEEAVVNNVESRPDSSKSNAMFDDSTNEIPNVGTISVVLPLVVGRQSSGKCTRNNVRERYEYESNGEDGAGNFTLPPISSDGSKSMRKGSNLSIELPSLSNGVDARSNEQAIHHRHHCEDSTNSCRIQKRSESEKELFKLEGVTAEIAANSDCSRKAIEKRRKEDDSRDDVNVHDIVSRKYPRESKSAEGSEALLTTGNITEQDDTQIPRQSGIIQRPRSSSSEEAEEIRETSKDSLSVTPDSIDLSEKTNVVSSKRLESERKNGEKERGGDDQDEEGNERQEPRYPEPNELERKLIEIETMEKSIENTLVSSRTPRTISNDFDNEFGESERSIEFSTSNVEPDCARNQQLSRVEDEWTKKNSDKCQSATSNESCNGDNDDNIEIDSVENEMSIRKRSNFDSDNSETFIDDQDDQDDNDDSDDSTNVGEIKRCSRSTRGIDVSCYVLTEGSPCEIPETVTTVIIPDKIVDNDDDDNVCKIELDDSTALGQFEIPSTWNSEIETKEGKHGEEHCQEENPFGEYIGPETIVHYSSSVDANFLRDVKDAADRVSAYQEDLANIKEEEENEDDRFSKVLQRSAVDRLHRGRIVDASEKSAESTIRETSIECKAKLTSFSRDQQQNKMDIGKEETSPCVLSSISDPSSKRDYAKHTAKNDHLTENREEEDVSLSFEQVGPTINVPELNLDSLQDDNVTTSSTIGESDSKNLLSNENGNVISSEDENISLSSFDALASSGFNERKLNDEPNDETLPFENDRARLFSEPTTKMTETGNETEGCSEFQRAEKFSNGKDDENESRYVEEEIARELIRNFIIDNTKLVESNDSTTFSSKPRANNTKPNQAEDFVIQFHPSVQDPSASQVAIGEISSRRGKLDNDTRADCEKGKEREKDQKKSEEARRQESGREARENGKEGNEVYARNTSVRLNVTQLHAS